MSNKQLSFMAFIGRDKMEGGDTFGYSVGFVCNHPIGSSHTRYPEYGEIFLWKKLLSTLYRWGSEFTPKASPPTNGQSRYFGYSFECVRLDPGSVYRDSVLVVGAPLGKKTSNISKGTVENFWMLDDNINVARLAVETNGGVVGEGISDGDFYGRQVRVTPYGPDRVRAVVLPDESKTYFDVYNLYYTDRTNLEQSFTGELYPFTSVNTADISRDLLFVCGSDGTVGKVVLYNFDTTWEIHTELSLSGGELACTSCRYDEVNQKLLVGCVNSSFYIFGWDGTNFTEETRVLYTDVNGIDSTADFGREVFIDSDSIIIGCPKQNEWKGSVVVYNYDGTTMSTPSIINNPRNISGQFGWSIYKIDQRVLIGVPYIISQGGSANAGEMHLFDFREPPGEFYNTITSFF